MYVLPVVVGLFWMTCGSLPVATATPLIEENPTPAVALAATDSDEVIGLVHASLVAPCAQVLTVTGVPVGVLPAVTGIDTVSVEPGDSEYGSFGSANGQTGRLSLPNDVAVAGTVGSAVACCEHWPM